MNTYVPLICATCIFPPKSIMSTCVDYRDIPITNDNKKVCLITKLKFSLSVQFVLAMEALNTYIWLISAHTLMICIYEVTTITALNL